VNSFSCVIYSAPVKRASTGGGKKKAAVIDDNMEVSDSLSSLSDDR